MYPEIHLFRLVPNTYNLYVVYALRDVPMVHLVDCSWAYVYVVYVLRDVPMVHLYGITLETLWRHIRLYQMIPDIYINRLYFRDLFVGGVRLRVYLYVLYGMSSFDMYSPRCNQFIYLFLVLRMIFENFVGVKFSCAVGGCNTMVLCPPPTVALRTLRGCSVEDCPR